MNDQPDGSSRLDPMIRALLRPEAYDPPVEHVELLQTHISWILLSGDFAYKIKKPVNLGFVDFSTPERRRHFCAEELRLNRRLAPELYLDLVAVRGPRRQARLHGAGRPIDIALRMRRFSQDALLPAVLGRGELPPECLDRLAADLAAFHASADTAADGDPYGSPREILEPALANLAVLGNGDAAGDGIAALHGWTLAEHRRLQAVFRERRSHGHVRECHGDLHLGNLVLMGDRIVVFDCLEFNPSLRWIDVISDMAFLVMDLQVRGARLEAARVLDEWLRRRGDYAGLRTWRWYQVYRSLVRAKVTSLQIPRLEGGDPGREQLLRQRQAYLDHALSSIRPGRAALVLTHGVSGSGKSHLARHLCRRLGWIRVSSDVERKRLFGRWGTPATVTLRGDPYSRETTDHLYGTHLAGCAAHLLAAGWSVIVDATFLRRRDRHRMQELAERSGCRFLILDCRISDERARRRIALRQARGTDPSEADTRVLALQRRCIEPLCEDEAHRSVVVEAREESPEISEALVMRITRALGETGAGAAGV